MIKRLEKVEGKILEAAMNCKIYHGPYVYNFEEIYEILEKNKISQVVNNYDELGKNLLIDLENNIKQNKKKSDLLKAYGQKTLDDTMILLNNFISNETN